MRIAHPSPRKIGMNIASTEQKGTRGPSPRQQRATRRKGHQVGTNAFKVSTHFLPYCCSQPAADVRLDGTRNHVAKNLNQGEGAGSPRRDRFFLGELGFTSAVQLRKNGLLGATGEQTSDLHARGAGRLDSHVGDRPSSPHSRKRQFHYRAVRRQGVGPIRRKAGRSRYGRGCIRSAPGKLDPRLELSQPGDTLSGLQPLPLWHPRLPAKSVPARYRLRYSPAPWIGYRQSTGPPSG